MVLYPGMWLHKIPSNRDAQVAGLDNVRVWLTWDDDGSQTWLLLTSLTRLPRTLKTDA